MVRGVKRRLVLGTAYASCVAWLEGACGELAAALGTAQPAREPVCQQRLAWAGSPRLDKANSLKYRRLLLFSELFSCCVSWLSVVSQNHRITE